MAKNISDELKTKFERRSHARPDEMLDAALSEFIKHGFSATRVEDIALAAGVSKGSIYRYFPSKQSLMEGLVKRGVTPISEHSLAMIGGLEGNPREIIERIIQMMGQKLSEPNALSIPKLIMREAISFPQIAKLYRDEVIELAMPALIGLIKQGIAQGHFVEVDAEMAVRSIVGPILAHVLLFEVFEVGSKDELALDRLIETHLKVLFNGLCAEPIPDQQ